MHPSSFSSTYIAEPSGTIEISQMPFPARGCISCEVKRAAVMVTVHREELEIVQMDGVEKQNELFLRSK